MSESKTEMWPSHNALNKWPQWIYNQVHLAQIIQFDVISMY